MTKKYLVLARSFINNRLVEEGDIVEYDGKPGTNLELIKEQKAEEPKAKKPTADAKDND